MKDVGHKCYVYFLLEENKKKNNLFSRLSCLILDISAGCERTINSVDVIYMV